MGLVVVVRSAMTKSVRGQSLTLRRRSPVQPSKAERWSVSTPVPMVRACNEEQPAKAWSPMVVTPSGRSSGPVQAEQPLKA